MALEIEWSKRADNSFDRIIDYLHSEWGNQVVQSLKIVYGGSTVLKSTAHSFLSCFLSVPG